MSHPSLHVADRCATTGRVLTQHVGNVQLRLHLTPKGTPAKTYTRHVLVLYTDGDQHPLLAGTFPLPSTFGALEPVLLPVRMTPLPPRQLLARWYASAHSEVDGLDAQELIACGAFAVGSTSSIRLVDVENTEQGVLSVDGWPFAAPASERPVNAPAQALIQQVANAYSRVRPVPRATDKFSSVTLHMGGRACALPLLLYPLHASLMRADPASATAYFEHALHLAAAAAGDGVTPQQLADVIALPSLGWVYRPDVSRIGEDADQWASLHTHPGGPDTLLAFDCEDGAKALLELLHVLQSVVLVKPSARLTGLQTLARRYVGYFAICELKSENGSAAKPGVGGPHYLNHALAILLRRDIRDRELPPITLESTAYCSGAWTPHTAHTLATEGRAYSASMRRMETTLTSTCDRENAHVRMPISLVAADRMYGRLLSLVSCTAGPLSDQTHHILLNVPLDRFLLLDGGDLALQLGSDMAVNEPTAKLLALFRAELGLLPVCRFPAPPLSAEPTSLSSTLLLLPAPPATPCVASTPVKVHADMSLYAVAN